MMEFGAVIWRRLVEFGLVVIDIIWSAVKRFDEARGREAAASISYYALFSLFPLLLALIILGSSILEGETVREMLMEAVREEFPAAQDVVIRNVDAVLERRSAVGVVALIGLIWSATGVFYNLVKNINRAWPEVNLRSFVKNRILALAIVSLLVVLLLFSFVVNIVLDIVAQFKFPIVNSSILEGKFWQSLLGLSPVVLRIGLFYALYSWIPNTNVSRSASLISALFTVVVMRLMSAGFKWVLSKDGPGMSLFMVRWGHSLR